MSSLIELRACGFVKRDSMSIIYELFCLENVLTKLYREFFQEYCTGNFFRSMFWVSQKQNLSIGCS
jgi:hypothetical protein